VITGIYAAAKISSFPGNGAPTAIFKRPVHSRVKIGSEGIVGDHQADRRVHGGRRRIGTLLSTIPKVAARFPEIAAAFVPGKHRRKSQDAPERLRISDAKRGVSGRSRGLIWTRMESCASRLPACFGLFG
jgi:hypothetical protein